MIPSTALGTKSPEGLYSVRVKGADGKITSKRVRIGVDNNVNAEVLSGLNEGEEVVVGEASATKTAKQGPMGPPPG
ncbi:hypothetical protein [Novosphingobium sp. ST904]|uniref:hypothetical protein n=1 Tax=Novosphingobium sp. ST904 TaxID=1684385 RepID=UPI000A61F983|nr:hypothetical protein [Novosphingobium sp. ST904]